MCCVNKVKLILKKKFQRVIDRREVVLHFDVLSLMASTVLSGAVL